MISNRRFARWLMITLIMAIGIGTFGALYIHSEKQKESTEARPETYLTNQRKKDIDMKELAGITGDYDADQWHLFISEDYNEQGPYLSLTDNASGDVGFEGRIMYLKNDIVITEINEDLYKGMPADWQPEGEGKYAILDYRLTGDGITLGYRGSEVNFAKQSQN